MTTIQEINYITLDDSEYSLDCAIPYEEMQEYVISRLKEILFEKRFIEMNDILESHKRNTGQCIHKELLNLALDSIEKSLQIPKQMVVYAD